MNSVLVKVFKLQIFLLSYRILFFNYTNYLITKYYKYLLVIIDNVINKSNTYFNF